jgi:hypothetical protein
MVQAENGDDRPLQQVPEDAEKPSTSERLARFPKDLLRSAKNVAKKTANLGRHKQRSLERQPTNPVALAARRVFRESVKAANWTFHIVSITPRTGWPRPLHASIAAGLPHLRGVIQGAEEGLHAMTRLLVAGGRSQN